MQYVVTTSHESKYPDPIQFSPGDRLALGKSDAEYPGWIRVTTPSGNEGWAPESYVRAGLNNHGIALSEYTARELNTRVGEHVSRLQQLNGWMWVENGEGQTGWIPAETVDPV